MAVFTVVIIRDMIMGCSIFYINIREPTVGKRDLVTMQYSPVYLIRHCVWLDKVVPKLW